MKTVSYTPETIPSLTDKERARLAKLASRPDNQIDLSDTAELTDEQWKGAVRGRFYRPIKQQITARLDGF